MTMQMTETAELLSPEDGGTPIAPPLAEKLFHSRPACNNRKVATDWPDMKNQTPLAEFLPYQLSFASNAVSGRIALEYRARFGLSIPEWRAMAVIGDYGPLTQRDVTKLTLMDKVAVNRACKVLEDRGLTSRRPNEADGRSHLLDLTESGRKMHDLIMPLAIEMERRLFANFTAEERATFRNLLDRVRAEVDELPSIDSEDDFGIS